MKTGESFGGGRTGEFSCVVQGKATSYDFTLAGVSL